MTIEEIELCCDNVRKKYNIIVPFEDGYELVYKMNGHIRESTEISDDCVGVIKKYNQSFWITLNANISEDCKKVAIAQLIGILCLYTPYENDEEMWNKYPEMNLEITEEMLENGLYFAKELLMPKYLFEVYFCENITIAHKINLKILANIFNVPVGLVRSRGIDLKMIVPKQEQKVSV